jgi:hypothetical protein
VDAMYKFQAKILKFQNAIESESKQRKIPEKIRKMQRKIKKFEILKMLSGDRVSKRSPGNMGARFDAPTPADVKAMSRDCRHGFCCHSTIF